MCPNAFEMVLTDVLGAGDEAPGTCFVLGTNSETDKTMFACFAKGIAILFV